VNGNGNIRKGQQQQQQGKSFRLFSFRFSFFSPIVGVSINVVVAIVTFTAEFI